MEAKEDFLNHGGEQFLLVPTLNSAPQWVDAVSEIIQQCSDKPLFSETQQPR